MNCEIYEITGECEWCPACDITTNVLEIDCDKEQCPKKQNNG